jgi:hypothetical protein
MKTLKINIMKKLAIILIAIVTFGLGSVSANHSDFIKSNTVNSNEVVLNILPYSNGHFVPMSPVYSKGEYSIYRVSASYLGNIPSCKPVGKNYHYFVYKNGQFLMTVNECNKEKVYSYFLQ